MSNNGLNLFKNDILNKLRELESKFFNELQKKNSEINYNFSTFNEKVNSILESNRKMIDSVTNQKHYFEKIKDLELSRNDMNQILITLRVKVNNLTSEMDKMRIRYDKIISENLIIPGYVGKGCSFKNMGDFAINSIIDIHKLKNEKEIMKVEFQELKSKVELMLRNMTHMVEYNSTRIREYTNSRDQEIEQMLDNKFKKYDEKSLETNQNLIDTQCKLEEKIKEIGSKLSISKNDLNTIINNKINEINERETELENNLYLALLEVKEVQKMKNELTEQIKNIYSKINEINENKNIKPHNKKIKNEILNLNQNIETNNNSTNIQNSNDFRNLETITINDLNSKNKETYPDSISIRTIIKGDNKVKLPFSPESEKENFYQNSFSEKKFILKDNNFTRNTQNLKLLKNINKKLTKDMETKNEQPIINSSKNNDEMKINQKIFLKTLNNIKNDKKENEERKIIYNNDLKNLTKNLVTNLQEKKLKLNSLEFTKKFSSDLLFPMSDDEISKEININLNIKKNNNIKYNDNKKYRRELENNNKIDKDNKFRKDNNINIKNYNSKKFFQNIGNNNKQTLINNIVQKNSEESAKKNIAIDCNLINLNLLDVPNINTIDNSSNNFLLYKSPINKRKIKSVDSKRSTNVHNNFEKNNNKFYSSKNLKFLKK